MSRRTRAFTLVELLLVIAVIMMLIGIIIVSMRAARHSANRTESANALRQMIGGYNSYSAENRQTLMPGYVEEGLIGEPTTANPDLINLRPRRANGEYFASAETGDISSYVWRLAPYLDHDWKVMMTDYRNTGLVTRMETEVRHGVRGPATLATVPELQYPPDPLGVASVPSFGMNSIFVGGDSTHGGPAATANHPFQNPVPSSRLAARRLSEVRNPTMLLVFGPVAAVDTGAAPGEFDPYIAAVMNSHLGYPELRPPAVVSPPVSNWTVWNQRQWEIGSGGGVVLSMAPPPAPGAPNIGGQAGVGGLPIVRWGSRQYPVANLDGSTTIEDIAVLANDMRRWSPFTTGLDPIVPQ